MCCLGAYYACPGTGWYACTFRIMSMSSLYLLHALLRGLSVKQVHYFRFVATGIKLHGHYAVFADVSNHVLDIHTLR